MPAPLKRQTLLSWGEVLTFQVGDHEFTSITQLQLTNLQDRTCRIKLTDLGLNFPLVHFVTGVMASNLKIFSTILGLLN